MNGLHELPELPELPAGRILIAVCTYNEAENMGELLARLTAAMPSADILVVDDDSPDGTAAEVIRLCDAENYCRVELLSRTARGLGGAIAAAMSHAVRHRYDWMFNLDADLSHPPEALPAMAARLAIGDCDVVVGSRYVRGGQVVGWPLHRRVMSRVVNRFTSAVIGLPVADASGSMRVYRVESLRRLDLEHVATSQRYAFLQQILLRLHRGGCPIAEVPIRFVDRAAGASKLSLGEAVASLWTVVAMAWRERR